MNIEGVTLSLLLQEQDKDVALTYFSELNQDYFSSSFKTVAKTIKDFYLDKGFVPSIGELEVYRSRDKKLLSALASIALIDCDNIDIQVAIEELANQYAQNTALDLFEGLLESISNMDRHELIEQISALPIKMEDKISSSEVVYTISDLKLFCSAEDAQLDRIYSGICDEWDHEAGGYYRQDLVLLGGKRGSGKSITCANLIAQQHKQKNVSVYFTIEDGAHATMERILCILSQVPYGNIKKKTTTDAENKLLAQTLASLFDNGEACLTDYLTVAPKLDLVEFQDVLYRECKEKEEGRIIIVDDRQLSVGSIDSKISSIKSKYGDKLALVVVDYVNQVILDGNTDMYDWKPQIVISKTLKTCARKNNICIVSPYQIDDTGVARFAKGILDAADVAQILEVADKESGLLGLNTSKARSANDTGKYLMHMDWKTLTIDPRPVVLDVEDDEDSVGSGKPIEGLEI
jgi:KaiC/GvpD/RAD55 family RecA-like ATPase|tara:strand:- start:1335 stop:2720 length:1386 start_codon:yes stop_codon:yes gene_type:complete